MYAVRAQRVVAPLSSTSPPAPTRMQAIQQVRALHNTHGRQIAWAGCASHRMRSARLPPKTRGRVLEGRA